MKKTTEHYVVIWFPPEGDKERRFKHAPAARAFAQSEDILPWSPLMERRTETIERTSTIVENWGISL
jgi:hypothetical protein